MKALTFLTKLKQSKDFDGNLEYSLDEAIAELKEAMKYKTCEECKYSKEEIECEDIKYFCKHHEISFRYYPPHGFCCNRYEPKDKK